jgi:Transcription factor/nuclear export subunit protein 2
MVNDTSLFLLTHDTHSFPGRFLRGVLRELATWFKDEQMYTADTKKGTTPLPGFAKAAPFPPTASGTLSWAEFKKFVKKIHVRLVSVSPSKYLSDEQLTCARL